MRELAYVLRGGVNELFTFAADSLAGQQENQCDECTLTITTDIAAKPSVSAAPDLRNKNARLRDWPPRMEIGEEMKRKEMYGRLNRPRRVSILTQQGIGGV